MNSNSTSRIPMLAGVGLAMAALLLLLPAPVHADTLNVTNDTYVDDGKTGKNFGSKKNIKIRDGSARSGFFKFDLSALGAATGADIDTATLRLFVKKLQAPGSIDIFSVDAAWTEGALTFATAPGTTLFLGGVAIPAGSARTWVLIDITALVKDWLDKEQGINGIPNHGTAIKGSAGSGIRLKVDSKEAKSKPLEIEVTHLAPGTEADDLPGPGHPHADVTVATGNHPHGAIFKDWERITTITASDSTSPKEIVLVCPTGKKLLGGGGRAGGTIGGNIRINVIGPDDDTTWRVFGFELPATTDTWFLRADAICADVP